MKTFPVVLCLALAGCAAQTQPVSQSRSTPATSTAPAADQGPPVEFDGTLQGWRVAPNAVLEAEFGNDLRNLDLDCDSRKVSPGTATDLDVKINYFPESALEKTKPQIEKWVCGSTGLSAMYFYSLKVKPFPTVGQYGELRIERVVTGRKALHLGTVWADRIDECAVAGLPAICYRNEQEGQVLIVVIEDDVLNPTATTLLVDAVGLPFDELVRMIEGFA